MPRVPRKQLRANRRVAIVWLSHSMRRQRIFVSICQRAALIPGLTIQHFDVIEADFTRRVLDPLRAWQPHGIIAHVPIHEDLRLLRRAMPRVPIVTANFVAEGDADAMVLSDRDELFRVMADHFRAQGLRSIAYFSANDRAFIEPFIAAFLRVVPDGQVFAQDLQMGEADLVYTRRHLRAIGTWLKALPRPCGVLTFEDFSGRHLVRICRMIGLHVPRDIQVIGSDDVDVCLSCDPHVTSIAIPDQRSGELCVDAVMRLMNRDEPRPPRVVPVTGFSVIPRGSTGPVTSARATMTQAIHLMNANAARGIQAGRIVKLTRSGHTSFYRQFRDSTGKTPGAYLRNLRLTEACRMMQETNASISVVAETCGFSSANYFSRFFARETGLSPRAWRLAHKRTEPAASPPTPPTGPRSARP